MKNPVICVRSVRRSIEAGKEDYTECIFNVRYVRRARNRFLALCDYRVDARNLNISSIVS